MSEIDRNWQIIGPIVEKIIARSVHKHIFGHFEHDDIAQEMRLVALEAYKGYHKDRGPLENYLARSIRNRIAVNLKRDNGFIVQTPCISHKCYFYDKKNRDCRWDKTKCLDWAEYEKVYESKCAINTATTYPTDNGITSSDSEIRSQLDEMLNLAAERGLACYGALESHLQCGTDIPPEHEREITELAMEVAH